MFVQQLLTESGNHQTQVLGSYITRYVLKSQNPKPNFMALPWPRAPILQIDCGHSPHNSDWLGWLADTCTASTPLPPGPACPTPCTGGKISPPPPWVLGLTTAVLLPPTQATLHPALLLPVQPCSPHPSPTLHKHRDGPLPPCCPPCQAIPSPSPALLPLPWHGHAPPPHPGSALSRLRPALPHHGPTTLPHCLFLVLLSLDRILCNTTCRMGPARVVAVAEGKRSRAGPVPVCLGCRAERLHRGSPLPPVSSQGWVQQPSWLLPREGKKRKPFYIEPHFLLSFLSWAMLNFAASTKQ